MAKMGGTEFPDIPERKYAIGSFAIM